MSSSPPDPLSPSGRGGEGNAASSSYNSRARHRRARAFKPRGPQAPVSANRRSPWRPRGQRIGDHRQLDYYETSRRNPKQPLSRVRLVARDAQRSDDRITHDDRADLSLRTVTPSVEEGIPHVNVAVGTRGECDAVVGVARTAERGRPRIVRREGMVVVHVHAERAYWSRHGPLQLHPLVQEVDRVRPDEVRLPVEVRGDRVDLDARVADKVTHVDRGRDTDIAIIVTTIRRDRTCASGAEPRRGGAMEQGRLGRVTDR